MTNTTSLIDIIGNELDKLRAEHAAAVTALQRLTAEINRMQPQGRLFTATNGPAALSMSVTLRSSSEIIGRVNATGGTFAVTTGDGVVIASSVDYEGARLELGKGMAGALHREDIGGSQIAA